MKLSKKDKQDAGIAESLHKMLLKTYKTKFGESIGVEQELWLASLFYTTTLLNIYQEGHQDLAIDALHSCNDMMQKAIPLFFSQNIDEKAMH